LELKTNMTTLSGNDKLAMKQHNRKLARDAESAEASSEPTRPSFLSDGPEQIRGGNC
jgi:hypothetical protein